MNVNLSSNLNTAALAQTQNRPPPPGGGGRSGPPDHAAAIEKLGSTLTNEAKDSLLAGVEKLEESGASFEEIKSFVDGELEANGIDTSGASRRSGQVVDIMS